MTASSQIGSCILQVAPTYLGDSPKSCCTFAHRPTYQAQLPRGAHEVLLGTLTQVPACLPLGIPVASKVSMSGVHAKVPAPERVCCRGGERALFSDSCYTRSVGPHAALTTSRILSNLPASESYKSSHGNNSVSIWQPFLSQSLKPSFRNVP